MALLVLAERSGSEAAATVRYLLDQGITIKVLSGDAPPTVAAIAERVGIPVTGGGRDASELDVTTRPRSAARWRSPACSAVSGRARSSLPCELCRRPGTSWPWSVTGSTMFRR